MQILHHDDSLYDQFLDLLGIRRRQPGLDALNELVTAFMTRIPFENISKLYYKKRFQLLQLPPLSQYLQGIAEYNFGGTCYSNNYFLNLLLKHLGYDARLCGADMNVPDCHLVNMVTLNGREYLIDPGYAAPFLRPLPRDLPHDLEIRLGRDRYVLRPKDEQGYSRIDLYRDGELFHGYTAKPTPREIDFFESEIQSSFTPESIFMSSLLVVRQFENRSVVIYNTTLIESEGDSFEITRFDDLAEMPDHIESHFAIPKTIASEALSQLDKLKNPWN